MTRAIKARDLAPALRRAIEAEALGAEGRTARATTRSSVVNSPRERTSRAPSLGWSCVACGAVSSSWAAAKRHADAEGHARIACVLREV